MAGISQELEIAFRNMNEDQKRMSFSMNARQVLPSATNPNGVRRDLLCALCQAILVDPLKCIDCKNNFHTACLNKFCRETGACPMMCRKPKFVPVKKELIKELQALKFQCVNSEQGCDKVLSYNELVSGAHDPQTQCKYTLVKCEAFSHCKTKCIRKDIEQHQSMCPFFLVPCIFCLKMVRRVEMAQHERETCDGAHSCPTCGILVQREELQSNSHNCVTSLTRYLYKAIDEKDQVIENLRDELKRKTQQISAFVEKQNHLENRLQRIVEVLAFQDGSDEEKQQIAEARKTPLKLHNGTQQSPSHDQVTSPEVQEPLGDSTMAPIKEEYKQEEEESKADISTNGSSANTELVPFTHKNNNENDLNLSGNELCLNFVRSGTVTPDLQTWPNFLRCYWRNGEETRKEVVDYFAQYVPEEIRDVWKTMFNGWYQEVQGFFKHPDWKLHNKNKDGSQKIYTRVSERQYLCLKSVAIVNEDLEDIYLALCDNELKKKYDETFEGGTLTYALPIDSSLNHLRYKKIMVVSARDLVVIGKGYRPSEKELYLFAKSCACPSIPEVKNYVRADTQNSGWRIKMIDEGIPGVKKPTCKLWFYSETDFKVSLFIQKQAGPKTGHGAKLFADYIAKHPLRKL